MHTVLLQQLWVDGSWVEHERELRAGWEKGGQQRVRTVVLEEPRVSAAQECE